MSWTVLVLLLLSWLVAFVILKITFVLVHLLLVLAAAVLVWRMMNNGRRV